MAGITALIMATTPLVPAWATPRQDALAELDRLRHLNPERHGADDARSTEATFAVAEHYFQTGDTDEADRFYLLTVQKARIILASIPSPSLSPAGLSPAAESPGEVPVIPSPSPEPAAQVQPDTPTSTDTSAFPRPAREADTAPATIEQPVIFQDSPQPLIAEGELPTEDISSEKLVGTASSYTVVKGDTIRLVAAKLGVSRQHIIRQNGLDEKGYLKIGQKLVYNNRKIVPQRMRNGIVVNIPDRTLYYFKQGKLAVSLPVALGVPVKSDKYDWKTPTGKFKVTAKMKDPTWHVPPSIQSEMEEKGKEIITSIPPGPENPLGKYAIKTSLPGIMIHSTTKPWSIYSFASHGCIRVYPEQMEELFREITVNTPGEIIYKPVKLAVTEQGRVFLEVHRDVYAMNIRLGDEARRLIEKQRLSDQVDWQKVEAVIKRKAGVAEEITL